MLVACSGPSPCFPPTAFLYNEGWLLRLLLDWFARHPAPGHPLGFSAGARWFSEGLLPTAFAARFRGDKLAEAHTHADGAIGHYTVGGAGRTDLALLLGTAQFVVLEAKMASGLSSGVANAPYFDQAARTVACIAEVLCRAGRRPEELSRLGFYVLAPQVQVERGLFAGPMERGSIRCKVEQRVQAYGGEKDRWRQQWFGPTLERIDLRIICWEEAIAAIGAQEPAYAAVLGEFYRRCLEFNGVG